MSFSSFGSTTVEWLLDDHITALDVVNVFTMPLAGVCVRVALLASLMLAECTRHQGCQHRYFFTRHEIHASSGEGHVE